MPVVSPDRRVRREALLSSSLFRDMRPAELDEVIGFAVDRRFAKGTMIFAKGDPGSSLMAVLAGRIRVGSISPAGREITLNVIGPGEIFGEIALLDGEPRSADAVAVADTHLMIVERQRFMPFLLRHDGLMERLMIVLCGRLRRTSTALEELALFDLPTRLARVLVKLGADYGRMESAGMRIDIKLSQRDLSNLVAGSRESVNKQLRIWKTNGVIDHQGGYIIVCRPQALRALCG